MEVDRLGFGLRAGRSGLIPGHPVGYPFADHNGSGIGIGSSHLGYNRRVGDPDSLDALDPALLVHHRHGVGVRPDFAGARYVARRTDGFAYPTVQGFVAGQNFVGGADAPV